MRLANPGKSARFIHTSVHGDSKVIRSVKLSEKHCSALQRARARHVPDAKKFLVTLSFSGQMLHPDIAAGYQMVINTNEGGLDGAKARDCNNSRSLSLLRSPREASSGHYLNCSACPPALRRPSSPV
jgi:hypothetical protein